ncbi:MAG: Flp pilus assembly complex ATPase component TadA [Desulfovibrio sp.]|nr:Flp pilus assembly complex ATPase component TadA [Desulfovibrio sp.]MBI4958459.1 Flp pilus assembly complex ATPase component TadA [Desulfovibrio sp.]
MNEAATALNERLRRAFAQRGLAGALLDAPDGTLLSDHLLAQGKASGQAVNEVLQEVAGVKAMDPSLAPFDPEFLRQAGKLLSRQEALAESAFPIRLEQGKAHVVMAVPGDEASRSRLEHLLGSSLVVYVCHGQGIRKAIETSFPEIQEDRPSFDPAVQAERAAKAISRLTSETGRERDPAEDAEVVALLRAVLTEMAYDGASDIHFEPSVRVFRVRCRKDGIMRVGHEFPPVLGRALVRRVKMLSGMDPAQTLLPQDGSIECNLVKERPLDIRVSALPSLYGEKLVLRLLDTGKKGLTLEDLSLEARDMEVLSRAIAAPNGLLLVTGPTGSGKTTTLYAVLGQLNTPRVNILTAEDPVEYRLDGITQVPCPGGDGMTFAQALRAFLRQDPDIVMVGEIRDIETADTAVKAAMTGHLVLSTLHTNDAAGAVSRLVNMGVPAHLVAGTRITVAAQRLVRRICEKCRKEVPPPSQDLFRDVALLPPGTTFYSGAGCEACRGTGYSGRIGVYEIFTVSEEMERIILSGAVSADIRRAAEADGMTTLRRAALMRLAQGLTTVEEVLRVTVDS